MLKRIAECEIAEAFTPVVATHHRPGQERD